MAALALLVVGEQGLFLAADLPVEAVAGLLQVDAERGEDLPGAGDVVVLGA